MILYKVQNLAHYEALLAGARGAGTVSNCCLLPDEVGRLCQGELLDYCLCEAGLLLWQTRGRDTRLMMVVDPGQRLDRRSVCYAGGRLPPLRGPVSCEWPTARDTYPPPVERLLARLEALGPVCATTARRMAFRPTAEQVATIKAFAAPEPLTVAVAGPSQADEILTLWEDTFDCVANQVPTRGELPGLLTQGQILYSWTDDGRLAGALMTEVTGTVGWVWHVVTAPFLRGQGIGRALMTAAHRLGLERGVTCFKLWVSDLDGDAEGFYRRLGYEPDGRTARTIIFTETR